MVSGRHEAPCAVSGPEDAGGKSQGTSCYWQLLLCVLYWARSPANPIE